MKWNEYYFWIWFWCFWRIHLERVESLRRSTWFSDVFSWWRVNGVVGVVGVLVHLVPGSWPRSRPRILQLKRLRPKRLWRKLRRCRSLSTMVHLAPPGSTWISWNVEAERGEAVKTLFEAEFTFNLVTIVGLQTLWNYQNKQKDRREQNNLERLWICRRNILKLCASLFSLSIWSTTAGRLLSRSS